MAQVVATLCFLGFTQVHSSDAFDSLAAIFANSAGHGVINRHSTAWRRADKWMHD